jgi:hypothetical protein
MKEYELTIRLNRLPIHGPVVLQLGVLDQAEQYRREPAVWCELWAGDGDGYVW